MQPHKTDEEIIAEGRNLVDKLGTGERSHLPKNPIQEELRALWHRTEVALRPGSFRGINTPEGEAI